MIQVQCIKYECLKQFLWQWFESKYEFFELFSWQKFSKYFLFSILNFNQIRCSIFKFNQDYKHQLL
jgi:hypothetical protein